MPMPFVSKSCASFFMALITFPTKVHPDGKETSVAISLPYGTSPNIAQMESITSAAVEPGLKPRHTGVQVNGRFRERKAMDRIVVTVSVPLLIVFESMMFPCHMRPGSPPCS